MRHTRTVCLFGCEVQFLLSGVRPVFQNLSYKLQKRLSGVLPNLQSHQKFAQQCTYACCGALSGFPLQYCVLIALAFGRGGVAKPSRDFPIQYRLLIALAFERGAGAKLSRGFPLQYHRFIGFRERRRGETIWTRPSSPLDSQMIGSRGQPLSDTFLSKSGLTPYRKYPPDLHPETYISKEYIRGIHNIKN